MRKTTALILVTLALPLLAACNTVAGAGRDIQSGGQVISNTASQVKRAITN